MTENEAKLLEKLDDLANDLEVDMYSVATLNAYFEECGNTIRGLVEEIQPYRVIGTVEELKELKENGAFTGLELAKIQCSMLELKKYTDIGTVEECRVAVERMKPKKGIPYTSSNNHKFVECPNCHKDMDLYYDYCQYCGQAVDWGKSKT